MQKAVVLLSGGLDSATCAAIAARERTVTALTFDYGSVHSIEIDAAKTIARHLEIIDHVIVKVGLDVIGGSSLTDPEIPVDTDPTHNEIGKHIPTSYVPARNIIFLSLGVALAEVRGVDEVYIGANAVDYSGYPDCRPEFIDAFQNVIAKGTKKGVEGRPVKITTPLLQMSKADIIRKGEELGVPFELTRTCYSGGEKACGRCEACVLRLAGFEEAGFDDPIEYER